jgi:hypothetical protein
MITASNEEEITGGEAHFKDDDENGEEDDDETTEPTNKKARLSIARERNKYKGMRIRQCLCGKTECLPKLKGWIDLGDQKRQGFKELPRQSSKTTPVGNEKNRVRDIVFLNLLGIRAPKYDENDKTNRERKLFVAYHHFHPLLLQEENKGPIQHVDLELAERIGGFHERDTVHNTTGIFFHPIPNYPRERAAKDFELAGGIEQQRYARQRSQAEVVSKRCERESIPQENTPKQKKEYGSRRRVREVLGMMERDPLKVANDYIQMQEQLRNMEHAHDPHDAVDVDDEEEDQFDGPMATV